MRAHVLTRCESLAVRQQPLVMQERPVPIPDDFEIVVRVVVCGVCHTELDEIEGRMEPTLPVIPGHQVVGRVEHTGSRVSRFSPGDRVGIGWIFSACGHCHLCRSGRENLCPEFQATGRDADGGYAEYMRVHEQFAFPIPDVLSDPEAAPLLCAGSIGYRSLRLARVESIRTLGLTGFGGSAHLVLKLVRQYHPGIEVFVFARHPDQRAFALELGAVWAGDSMDRAPVQPESIIDTTPAWKPVVGALANLAPGGRLVINAIRKETTDQEVLGQLRYEEHLWLEKEIKSVANVTRKDIAEFLTLAGDMHLQPAIEVYPFEEANRALRDLKNGAVRGSKVLKMD